MAESRKPIPFSPPDITEAEIEAVADALRSGWITTGPRTKELERRLCAFTGADGFVCLNSATAALECALRLLGVGPGDEVITSAYTYTASASPIHHVGAKIVLVDTAPGSYEMDYMALSDAITERTKAVIRAVSATSSPMIFPISRATSMPPTGQAVTGALPFTIASATPSQPG